MREIRKMRNTERVILGILLLGVTSVLYSTMFTYSYMLLPTSFRGNEQIAFDDDDGTIDTSSVDKDYKAATSSARKNPTETKINEESDKSDLDVKSSSLNPNNGATSSAEMDADSDDAAVNADTGSDEVDHNEPINSKDRRRMNVVVLFPDDWRYNSVGAENPLVKTPFLDSLADQGIRFRQNAVTTSICWQSRATLFTGQWASRHQSYKLKCPHFAKGEKWNSSWPALLQNDGYFVGHVGKWQYHNDNKGRFDYDSFFEGRHWFRKNKKKVAAEDLAKDETIRFLNTRPKDKPFAVTVAFYPPKPVGSSNEPGGQWTPKKESRALYDNVTIPEPFNHTKAFNLLPEFLRRYGSAAAARWRLRYSTPLHYQEAMKNIYALITQVDQACKEIVDELKKQGIYNNTMVIFTTDNGMFHGSQ